MTRRLGATLASSHQKIGFLLLGTGEASSGVEHLRKALALYLDLDAGTARQ